MTPERFNEFTEKLTSSSDSHLRPNMTDPREMATLRQDRTTAQNQNVLENGFLRLDNPYITSNLQGSGANSIEHSLKQILQYDQELLRSIESFVTTEEKILAAILRDQSAATPSDNSGGAPATTPSDNSG